MSVFISRTRPRFRAQPVARTRSSRWSARFWIPSKPTTVSWPPDSTEPSASNHVSINSVKHIQSTRNLKQLTLIQRFSHKQLSPINGDANKISNGNHISASANGQGEPSLGRGNNQQTTVVLFSLLSEIVGAVAVPSLLLCPLLRHLSSMRRCPAGWRRPTDPLLHWRLPWSDLVGGSPLLQSHLFRRYV